MVRTVPATLQGKSASGVVRFDVDSHILFQLGEKLFARKPLALAELVKNSYDADATVVKIIFQNVTKPHGTIVVDDNGDGMTYELLLGGWMRIATFEKNRNPISRKFHRSRAGQKGVGRFACRVLSNRLRLESVSIVSSGKKEKVTALFDWQKFKSGSRVDDVEIPVTRESVPFDTPTGTKLALEDVPEIWTADDIHVLRKGLISLISFFTPQAKTQSKTGDSGFQTIILSPEFKEEQGPLSEQYLERYAWGRLVGTVDKSGEVQYTLIQRRPKITQTHKPKERFPSVGNFTFRIDFIRYAKDQFPGGDISLREAQQIGREEGGVRIYHDGFRVLPYGEPNDDWLSLDSDRARNIGKFRQLSGDFSDVDRPSLFLPGNYQLFGAIFLSRVTNPGIQITMTRERLLDNDALNDLTRSIRLGIEWMTVQYARWVAKNKPKTPEKEVPLDALHSARDVIIRHKDKVGPEATSEILQAITLAENSFAQREEDRIGEISMLRILATSGTLILIFQHELGVMIDEVQEIAEDIDKLRNDIAGKTSSNELQQISERITSWVGTVRDYCAQLGLLLGVESRSARRSYPLRPLLDEVVRPFSRHFSEYGIVFTNNVDGGLRMPPMFKAEIISIFLNLMTNSAKAVKEREKRRLLVESSETNEEIIVRFLDTGPGILAERRSIVFEPFVSDSAPDPLFGEGTGLGLTIVRNLIDTYGGDVKIIDPPADWGTCVEIRLPKKAF